MSTKSRYRIIGGTGGFDGWRVDESDAAPVAVELEYLYELIDPRVFKDGTGAEVLREKQQLIKTATFEHLRDMPKLAASLPAPRVYSVTLEQLRVTEEVDDANKATWGTVTATVAPAVPGFDGTLWSQADWSHDLSYQKGKTLSVGRKSVVVQHPSASGQFQSLDLSISADITERDDCCGHERHTGSASVKLDELEVNETRHVAFDAAAFTTLAERGTVKLTATVRREPSEFLQ